MRRHNPTWFDATEYKKVLSSHNITDTSLQIATGLSQQSLANYKGGKQPGTLKCQIYEGLTIKQVLAIGLLKHRATREQLIAVGYRADELQTIVCAAAANEYNANLLTAGKLNRFGFTSTLQMFCRAGFTDSELIESGYSAGDVVEYRNQIANVHRSDANVNSSATEQADEPLANEKMSTDVRHQDSRRTVKQIRSEHSPSETTPSFEGLEAALCIAIQTNWKNRWSNQ